jgi:DNA-3-methyladenine glycosylase II
MVLMFRLGRLDILPTADLVIQKGVKILYGLRTMPTPERLERIGTPWAPYRTIACWYIWRVVDQSDEW